MTDALPPAVVFDCDGTLADTESLSDRAWAETLAAYGYEPTAEDFRAVIGYPFAQNWQHYSAKVDLGDQDTFRQRLRARFHELFDAELELYADAMDTLRELAARGVRIGVASSSTRRHVLRVLERGGLTDLVSVIVGADDVKRHKPHPEPYLRAAERLAVDPAGAVAVEDTAVGVTAATQAGMYTVAVLRGHHEPEELAAADRVVERVTLDAVRPARRSRPATDTKGGPWT